MQKQLQSNPLTSLDLSELPLYARYLGYHGNTDTCCMKQRYICCIRGVEHIFHCYIFIQLIWIKLKIGQQSTTYGLVHIVWCLAHPRLNFIIGQYRKSSLLVMTSSH